MVKIGQTVLYLTENGHRPLLITSKSGDEISGVLTIDSSDDKIHVAGMRVTPLHFRVSRVRPGYKVGEYSLMED